MVKIDQKLCFSIKKNILPGRPGFKPPARPPPPPDRGLPATRPRPNYRPRGENMPFKKNIETLGRKNIFLFWYTPIYIKIRNGQTLAKVQVFLLKVGGCTYMSPNGFIFDFQTSQQYHSTRNFEPDPFLRSRRSQIDQNRPKTAFFIKKSIFGEVGPYTHTQA